MNNCMDRNFNNTKHLMSRNDNNSMGEKIIAFFCFIIAIFEISAVDAVCRVLLGCAVAVGAFFYASAVMGGTVSFIGALLYGALIVAAAAFVFRAPHGGNE